MPTNYGVARRPLRQDFLGKRIVKFMRRKDHHWTIWFDDGDKLDCSHSRAAASIAAAR